MEDQECVICKKTIGDSPKATLGEKGCATINQTSKVNEAIHCTVGQQVHQECRRKYCASNQIAKALRMSVETDESVATGSQTILRSAERRFEYNTHSFYCGEPVACEKKENNYDVVTVRTVETKATILATCQERGDSCRGVQWLKFVTLGWFFTLGLYPPTHYVILRHVMIFI